MKKIILLICISILFTNVINIDASSKNNFEKKLENSLTSNDDFDPLVDIVLTINITEIRPLDIIDKSSYPDFFIKLFINDELFISPIWNNTNYLLDCWSITKNVPDDVEFVKIKFELLDWNNEGEQLCDIGNINNSVEIYYSIKTGHWSGDDYLKDSSGYGRLNGCDDGSIYKNERDCELWFKINQNDFDKDGIPYWTEVNIYNTDPKYDNTNEDSDNDGCPIEWEFRWGFNPFYLDDHKQLDFDDDSINNYEEYLTRDLGSDPFRKDLFLEIDYMAEGPNGEESIVPEDTSELLKLPFHRRNIVFFIDIGYENGGEVIAFDDETDQSEVIEIYNEYFQYKNNKSWRRSVFHYGFFVYLIKPNGFAFSGNGAQFWGYGPGTNSFVISSKNMIRLSEKTQKSVAYIYASSIMHETGHNFGIRWGHPFGCDARFSIKPWQIGFWLFLNYKSIMNYIYTYSILDFSDGSHGRRDFNDWDNLDFSHFEIPEGFI
jgi:hypothetical protein